MDAHIANVSLFQQEAYLYWKFQLTMRRVQIKLLNTILYFILKRRNFIDDIILLDIELYNFINSFM